MKDIQLVVFDLDGTLLNTLQDLTNAVNHAVALAGVAPYSCEQVRRMIGDGAEILLRRALGKDKEHLVDSIYQQYSQYYDANLYHNTRPYDGIVDCLKVLKQQGIKIGVFSNKADNQVKALCNDMLQGLVDYTVGRQHKGERKPNPFGLLDIMRQSGIDSNHTVFVGDSTVDIDTAHNGNVPCISVSWGYNDKEQLLAYGAQAVADNSQQLLDLLLS